jgi:DNA-binding MarR family transcriptional regulator
MGRAKKQGLLETTRPARETEREPSMRVRAMEGMFLLCCAHIQMSANTMKVMGAKGFSPTKARILAFATLTPGLTVGELVQYMRVSHQSVNEPLRRLINEGYIVAKIGVEDRRHKKLFATRKGTARYMQNVRVQVRMFEDAFRAMGLEATNGFLEVQRRLVEPGDREWIARALRVAEKSVAGG